MILRFFIFALASVFPLNEYPKALIQEIDNHFKAIESASTLTPICTKGAMRAYYFQLDLPQRKFFVKYGEKVKAEIQNQMQFANKGYPFPPLAQGTSLEKAILVRPFLTEPNYGFEIVDRLYRNEIDSEQFIILQAEIFSTIFKLYTSPSNSELKSKYFIDKVSERLSALLTDPSVEEWLKKADVEGLTRNDLFGSPIVFQGQKLPSVNEMVADFNQRFEKIPELKQKYLVHGDMHPPNIAKDQTYGIVLIDLSDLKLQEDPCWDLGKWLNHVNRLHVVVQKRDANDVDHGIILKKKAGYLDLIDNTIYPSGLEKIDRAAVGQLAQVTKESQDLITVRTKAAEFVANVNTMKRHIELFPHMTKRILCLIVESYIAWDKAMKEFNG